MTTKPSKILVVNASGRNTSRVSSTIVTIPRNRRKRRNRQRSRTAIPRGMGLGPVTEAYYKCLCDPFNNPPVRIGFGTMVPTQLHTAYLRTSFSANSTDGSLNLFALPNQNNLLLVTNSTVSLAPVAANSQLLTSANATILNNMFDLSRTVAMGMRMYPMIPATSVPGVIAMGCSPRSDLNDFVASAGNSPAGSGLANFNTSFASQMPYLREHIARPSSADFFQVTWRPTDIKDFEFTPGDSGIISKNTSGVDAPFYDVVSNGTSGFMARQDDTQGSFLVATWTGLPASTSVYVEVVLHLETVDTTNPLASTDFSATSPSTESVANEGGASMESVYRTLVASLPTVDTVAGTATSLLNSPMARTFLTRYASQIMGVRSTGFELV